MRMVLGKLAKEAAEHRRKSTALGSQAPGVDSELCCLPALSP